MFHKAQNVLHHFHEVKRRRLKYQTELSCCFLYMIYSPSKEASKPARKQALSVHAIQSIMEILTSSERSANILIRFGTRYTAASFSLFRLHSSAAASARMKFSRSHPSFISEPV